MTPPRPGCGHPISPLYRGLHRGLRLFAAVGAAAALLTAGVASAAKNVVADVNGNVFPVKRESVASQSALRSGAGRYKEGELLVKFKPGVSDSAKAAKHRRQHAEIIRDHKTLRLHRLRLSKGMTVDEAAARYKSDPDVEYAEPNYIVSVQNVPNDPQFSQLWGMTRINAPSAWGLTTGDNNVVVAILDTGIDYTHPDLAGNLWLNQGELNGAPGADNDGNGYIGDIYGYNAVANSGDPMDDHYHGTHVAGTIGAVGNNGTGVAGLNWNVKLMACKFLDAGGSGTIDDAVECLQYVKTMKSRGANIVATSNSWGSPSYSQALYDAIRDQKDILFVAAAGNDNSKALFYPAGYDLPNVISVAASDETDARASFSNYNKWGVDVAAPGTNILSTFPGQNYYSISGTSMATPHVSGLAALLKAQNGSRSTPTLKNLILSSGDTLSAFTDITVTGKRINAYNALTCTNRPLFGVLHLPASPQAGVPEKISATSVNCATPIGPVSATLSGGGTIQLRDDGVSPDEVAGDGIFTGTWIPAGSGVETLTFTSPLGTTAVSSPPVTIGEPPTILAPAILLPGSVTSATINTPFNQTFPVFGGLSPFTWSLISGSLPAGLTLNSQTGEISGAPTAAGVFPITMQAADSLAVKDRKDWTLLLNDGLRPGWPRELQQRPGSGILPTSYSPTVADLDGDGNDEVIVGDMETLYVFYPDGTSRKAILPGTVTTPVVADLDGDGRKEIIVSVGYHYASSNTLYAFHSDLTPVTGFPAGSYSSYNGGPGDVSSPVVADFNGDGELKIAVVASPNNIYDPNYQKNVVIMVDSHGQTVAGWPQVFGTSNYDDSPPAAGDLYQDGKKELVLATADGNLRILRPDGALVNKWQFDTNIDGVLSPALADLDGDGYLDIVLKYGSTVNGPKLTAYNRNGILLHGWPRQLSALPPLGPVVADVDGDGHPEVVVVTGPFWNEIDIFRGDGKQLPGWPLLLTGTQGTPSFNCYPVAADINGDGKQEIILTTIDSSNNGKVLGYAADGTPLPGFPKYASPASDIRSTAAIGNLDGNGKLDLIVKSENGFLYAWEIPQNSGARNLQWPMFRGDEEHSGTWIAPGGPRAMISGAPTGASRLTGATLTVTGSGIVSYKYRVDGGSYSAEILIGEPITLAALGEGAHFVAVLGKEASGTWQVTPTVVSWIVDLTAPTTTVSPGGGTYGAAQRVTLTCSDGSGGGCAGTWYCLGTSCPPTTQYDGPVTVAASTDLRFYSMDRAGNTEGVQAASYSLSYALNVVEDGNGVGTVTGTNISCITGSVTGCSSTFASGSVVTLTAAAASGSTFISWSDGCSSVSGNQCSVTMDGSKTVTATFTVTPPVTTLTLNPTIADGASGWYVTTPTATFSSDKQGTTYYRWGSALGYTPATESHTWISGGTALGIRGDDTGKWYDLPFGFPFYGTNYTRVYILSNGLLRFDAADTAFFNTAADLSTKVAIAPLWDDLRTDQRTDDDVYVFQPDSDSVGFRWQALTLTAFYDTNFEVILYRDGRIRFNYGAQAGGLTPTIGISKGDGATYQIAYDNDLASASNIASILYTPYLWETYTGPLTPGSGDNILNYYSVDTIGTSEGYRSQHIKVDTAVPSTSASPPAGEYNSAESVTLSCSDGTGSGCAATYYCLGSGCTPTTPYTVPVSIATATDLRFYSEDVAGNREAVKVATYSMDLTPPTTTATPGGGTYTGTQNVSLTCDDGTGSGCAGTWYCLGTGCTPTTAYTGAIALNSSTSLRFYSKDSAGNSETVKTATYTITLPPPVTIATPGAGTYATAPAVTLTCNTSPGTTCAATYYCLGSGCSPSTLYSSPIKVYGSTDFRFFSKDVAGQSEAVQTVTYLAPSAPSVINVPADEATIQAAIYVAHAGTTVIVAPGTYQENLNFVGKAITVRSSGGADATIIDGNRLGPVVTFASGETTASVLDSFTIRNGKTNFSSGYGGGGIYVLSSSPTISNNKIVNNTGCEGVGLYAVNSAAIISRNTISNNSRSGCSGGNGGGGIQVNGSSTTGSVQIINNEIENNSMTGGSGGGVTLVYAGAPVIRGNIIRGNSASGVVPCAKGGGIYTAGDTRGLIVQNIISGNTAGCGGGISWSYPFSTAYSTSVVNNTIIDNDSPLGSGIHADGFDSNSILLNNIIVGKSGQSAVYCGSYGDTVPPQMRNNAVYSPSGTRYGGICSDQGGINGNISADPLLYNPTVGKYYLKAGSPAIDAGDNTASSLPSADLDGNQRIIDGNRDGIATVDMGAFEFDPTPPTAVITGAPQGFTTSTAATISVGGTGVISYRYAVDGDSYTIADTPLSTPVSLSGLGPGPHSVAVIGKDVLGREQLQGSATTATWTVDYFPPTTAATPPGEAYLTPQAVTLSCNDGTGSGCAGTWYCLGTGCTPTTPYSGAITISSSTDLRFSSTDIAGNSEPIQTATYTIGCGGSECPQVITGGSWIYGAGINSLGEVVWSQADANGYFQIYSSTRGQLTFDQVDHYHPAINSLGDIVWDQQVSVNGTPQLAIQGIVSGVPVTYTIGDVQSPKINDKGEVIWQQQVNISWQVYSNLRGRVTWEEFDHYQPAINNLGDIAWAEAETFTPPFMRKIRALVRGAIVDLVPPGPGEAWSGFGFNDQREAVWVQDEANGSSLYSSTRGQLTFSSPPGYYYSPSLNNCGDVVFQVRGQNDQALIYRLGNASPCGASAEPNDTQAQATPLPSGNVQTGLLDTAANAVDWYRIDLAAGETATVTGNYDSRPPNAMTMALYDGPGLMVAGPATGTPLTLAYTAPEAGTWYLRVSASAGRFGYGLRVQRAQGTTGRIRMSGQGQSDTFFDTFGAAFAGALSGDFTMMVQTGTFAEDLNINICDRKIRLTGGFDGGFSANNGKTSITGALRITCGTVSVENMALK